MISLHPKLTYNLKNTSENDSTLSLTPYYFVKNLQALYVLTYPTFFALEDHTKANIVVNEKELCNLYRTCFITLWICKKTSLIFLIEQLNQLNRRNVL